MSSRRLALGWQVIWADSAGLVGSAKPRPQMEPATACRNAFWEEFWSYGHLSQFRQSSPFRVGPSIVSSCLQEEGVCYLVPSDHHISPRAATHSKVSSVGSPGFLGLFVDSHVAHAFLLGTPCICGDVLFVLLLKWLSYRCPQHPTSPTSPPFTVAMVILLHTTETPQRPRGSFFHSHTCLFNCVCVKQTLKKCFLSDQNNPFI